MLAKTLMDFICHLFPFPVSLSIHKKKLFLIFGKGRAWLVVCPLGLSMSCIENHAPLHMHCACIDLMRWSTNSAYFQMSPLLSQKGRVKHWERNLQLRLVAEIVMNPILSCNKTKMSLHWTQNEIPLFQKEEFRFQNPFPLISIYVTSIAYAFWELSLPIFPSFGLSWKTFFVSLILLIFNQR